MKKTYKVLSVLAVMLMVVCTCSNVFAAIDINKISASVATSADSSILNFGSKVLSIITSAGMILAVVVVAVLGVKYMMGSTEEKAEYKKTLLPYFIGAILVFGASGIGKLVYNFGKSF